MAARDAGSWDPNIIVRRGAGQSKCQYIEIRCNTCDGHTVQECLALRYIDGKGKSRRYSERDFQYDLGHKHLRLESTSVVESACPSSTLEASPAHEGEVVQQTQRDRPDTETTSIAIPGSSGNALTKEVMSNTVPATIDQSLALLSGDAGEWQHIAERLGCGQQAMTQSYEETRTTSNVIANMSDLGFATASSAPTSFSVEAARCDIPAAPRDDGCQVTPEQKSITDNNGRTMSFTPQNPLQPAATHKRKLKVNTSAEVEPTLATCQEVVLPTEVSGPRKKVQASNHNPKLLVLTLSLQWLWKSELYGLDVGSAISRMDAAHVLGRVFHAYPSFSCSARHLSLDPVITRVHNGGMLTRRWALDVLRLVKSFARPHLQTVIECLKDDDQVLKAKALETLIECRCHSASTLDTILRTVDEGDDMVCYFALEALQKSRSVMCADNVREVAARLQSKRSIVRSVAVSLLGSLGQLAAPYTRKILALSPGDGAPDALQKLRQQGIHISQPVRGRRC